MPELEPNVGASGKTPPPVIAARLALLLLAGAAAVWAFAFSEERVPASAEQAHAHIHGAAAHGSESQGESGEDAHAGHHMEHESAEDAHAGHHMAQGSAEDVHAGHQHAENAAPAASAAAAALLSAGQQNHKVIGVPQRRVFTIQSRASAWLDADSVVTAVLRKDELAGLSPGEHGMFFRANAPALGIHVRLSEEPAAVWDESMARVRFRLKAPVSGLRSGEVGWVMLAARSREVLVIPSGAVLYAPAGPYVLAMQADGRTLKRRVEIGSVSRGLAVVLAGLSEGEPIVVNSAFSWDVERRLQPRHNEVAGVIQ